MASRWGLTLPLPGISLADHEEHVRRAEEAGYTDLWTGETAGPDGFTPLALSAAWTERMRLGTGIVGVFQRGPALLAHEGAALAPGPQGRFVLGVGSSPGRGPRCWRRRPRRSPTPPKGASSSASAPPRTGSSKAGTASRSRSRSRR